MAKQGAESSEAWKSLRSWEGMSCGGAGCGVFFGFSVCFFFFEMANCKDWEQGGKQGYFPILGDLGCWCVNNPCLRGLRVHEVWEVTRLQFRQGSVREKHLEWTLGRKEGLHGCLTFRRAVS